VENLPGSFKVDGRRGEDMFERQRVRRRGVPVFAFVDHDVSDEPFLVDRVASTAREALFNALFQLSPTEDATVYVTDPFGEVFQGASFDSAYAEAVWVAEAKELAVAGGAAAIAEHLQNRRFRKRYGSPTT
jgi:hypothetical protein